MNEMCCRFGHFPVALFFSSFFTVDCLMLMQKNSYGSGWSVLSECLFIDGQFFDQQFLVL
jgi:hypothetical protein